MLALQRNASRLSCICASPSALLRTAQTCRHNLGKQCVHTNPPDKLTEKISLKVKKTLVFINEKFDKLIAAGRKPEEPEIVAEVVVSDEDMAKAKIILLRSILRSELLKSLLSSAGSVSELVKIMSLWCDLTAVSSSDAAFFVQKLAMFEKAEVDTAHPELMFVNLEERRTMYNNLVSSGTFCSQVHLSSKAVMDKCLNLIDVTDLNYSEALTLYHALMTLLMENEAVSSLSQQTLEKILLLSSTENSVANLEMLIDIAVHKDAYVFWSYLVVPCIRRLMESSVELRPDTAHVLLTFSMTISQYTYDFDGKTELLGRIEQMLEKFGFVFDNPIFALQYLEYVNVITKDTSSAGVSKAIPIAKEKAMDVVKAKVSELKPYDFQIIIRNKDLFSADMLGCLQQQAESLVADSRYGLKDLVWCLPFCHLDRVESERVGSLRDMIPSSSIYAVLDMLEYYETDVKKQFFTDKTALAVIDIVINNPSVVVESVSATFNLCKFLTEIFMRGIVEHVNLSRVVDGMPRTSSQYELLSLVLLCIQGTRLGDLKSLCKSAAVDQLFKVNRTFYLARFYKVCCDMMNKDPDCVEPVKQCLRRLLDFDGVSNSHEDTGITCKQLVDLLKCSTDHLALSVVLDHLGIYKAAGYSDPVSGESQPAYNTDESAQRHHNVTTSVIAFMLKKIQDNIMDTDVEEILLLAVLTSDFTSHPCVDLEQICAVVEQYLSNSMDGVEEVSKREVVQLLQLVSYGNYLGADLSNIMTRVFSNKFVEDLNMKFQHGEFSV